MGWQIRWPRGARQNWADVAYWSPVVGVAVISQTGIGLEQPWTGSGLTLGITGLMLAAPLALRARYPLTAVVLLVLAMVTQQTLGGSLHFGTFVAVLVASYSLGRYGGARITLLGVPVLLGGILISTRDSLPGEAADLVFPLFYTSAAVGLGMVVRRLIDQTTELRRLNEALTREREATALLAVASERMRLARDLHDVIAHTLTVAVVQAEDCEEAIADDPERARAAARRIQEVGRRGLSDLRGIVRVLRDGDRPTEDPGLADIDTLAAVMSSAGLDVVIRWVGDPETVPSDLGRDLFRVVQEGLTNVLKHSASTTGQVTVVASAADVEVTVVDPGPAVGGGLPSAGHGIAGMRERLASYGGTVTVQSVDGFALRASAPLGVRA
jgi:signal transduction histidine kinase